MQIKAPLRLAPPTGATAGGSGLNTGVSSGGGHVTCHMTTSIPANAVKVGEPQLPTPTCTHTSPSLHSTVCARTHVPAAVQETTCPGRAVSLTANQRAARGRARPRGRPYCDEPKSLEARKAHVPPRSTPPDIGHLSHFPQLVMVKLVSILVGSRPETDK